MQEQIKWYLLLLICIANSAVRAADWDVEYWQYLTVDNWKQGKCRLYTLGEIRFNNDISRVSYYRIAENFAYSANRYVDFEAHYSFLYHVPAGDGNFKSTHRIEFEVNPSIPLGNGYKLLGRNRAELIRSQGNSHWQTVLRHRSRLIIPICGWEWCWGKVVSYNISDEIFYDANRQKFTQNRFIPLEFSFEFPSSISMNAFFMVRNNYSFSMQKWYRSFVLGSYLSF